MKKLLSHQLILFIATFFFGADLTAQDSSYQVYASYNEERPLPVYYLRQHPASYPDISALALIAFKKDFGHATDVKWSLENNGFMARFINDGRKTTVLFDKKGRIVYSIAEGTIKNLPSETRKLVRSIYYDFDITSTKEVNSYQKKAWFMNLEDETSYITIRVMNGEIVETGNYRKAK